MTGNVDKGVSERQKDQDGNTTGTESVPARGGDGNAAAAGMLTWLDMAAITGVFFIANLAGGLLVWMMGNTAWANHGLISFLSYIITFTVTIIFAFRLCRLRGASGPSFEFSPKKSYAGLVLWGFVLVMVTSVVIEPLLQLFPAEGLERVYESIGTGGWAVMTSVVAAPVMEEVLFRGIIQRSLTDRFGGWRGVLAASAIFAIVHLIPQQMVNAFFVGIILGYIYVKTGSLLPVILIHALNNAVAFIQMKIFDNDATVTVRGLTGNDTLYWIVYGLFGAVFVMALLNLWRQLKAVPAGGVADGEK